MKKSINLLAAILACVSAFAWGPVPSGKAVMTQLQPRDSILIADQISYSVSLEGVENGTMVALPDLSAASNDTLTLVRGWQLDTLVNGKEIHSRNAKAARKLTSKPFTLRASIVLAPFEAGIYELPSIPLVRNCGSVVDTLLFEGLEMEVKTMPVDTATFQIHDIKDQIQYPLTFSEMAPWIGGALLLAAIIAAIVFLIRRSLSRKGVADAHKDPAYIIALRELDKYRGDKFWAPEKQKQFYSAVTDVLKFYIDDRFGVDAPEMTTAELFAALKGNKDITPEQYNDLKELFERADFVKFAKYSADDEDNAKVLPLAVGFVTSTYQTQLQEENAEADGKEAAQK